jgi:hypothetical protein
MALGEIIGAFGKTKTTQQLYNEALGKAITGSAESVAGNRALSDQDIAAYGAASKGAAARTEGLVGQDNATMAGMIGRAAGYDPMAAYRGLGDYQTGLFNQFAKGLANQGKAAQNLQFARMGYGGGSGSTYTGRSVMDRISGNLAPAYASVLGNLGRDTSLLNQAQLGQTSAASNLMNQRIAAQGAPAQYLLNPALARAQMASQESANLGQLAGAAKGNTAGFRAEQDLVGKLGGAIASGEKQILDLATSTMNAAGGGLFGGLFGGSKAPQTPAYQPPPATNFGSSGGFYYPGGFGYNMSGGDTGPGPSYGINVNSGGYGAGIGGGYRPGT